MAKLIKFGRWVRNNWKKSVFISAVAIYGADFGNTEYKKNLVLRAYCKDAVKYGDCPIPVFQSPRHILVILNPVANKEKAKKEYQKYCAPLLHLSGAKVTLLNTSSRYDATNLVEKITNDVDAVIVAGGDGTVSEVVTGIIRRRTDGTLEKKIPIGIAPLGKYNFFAKSLYSTDVQEDKDKKVARVRLMMVALSSVLKEITNPVHVMEIEDTKIEEEKIYKPIYAMKDLQWGPFRDAHANMNKYWCYGMLRSYVTYIFGARNLKNPVKAELTFTPPCSGCSKCYQTRMDTKPERRIVGSRRWWHAFLPRTSQIQTELASVDYNTIHNETCGETNGKVISTVDLSITPATVNGTPSLCVEIGPETIGYFEFIKDGWSRENNEASSLAKERIYAQELIINPLQENEENKVENWMSVDSEYYDVKPIKLSLLHNVLPIFFTNKNYAN